MCFYFVFFTLLSTENIPNNCMPGNICAIPSICMIRWLCSNARRASIVYFTFATIVSSSIELIFLYFNRKSGLEPFNNFVFIRFFHFPFDYY